MGSSKRTTRTSAIAVAHVTSLAMLPGPTRSSHAFGIGGHDPVALGQIRSRDGLGAQAATATSVVARITDRAPSAGSTNGWCGRRAPWGRKAGFGGGGG